MSVQIRIGTETGRVYVKSPYNKAFVERARELNGKWVASTSEWGFDGRDEQRVRDLCIELYGTDGRTQTNLVTLRVALGSRDGSDISLGGRSLVRRKGRDYRAELGEGVIVLEGGFPSSGGSVKNPRVAPHDGTVLEVRDFPESLAKDLLSDSVQIVGESYTPKAVVLAPDPLTQAIESGLARINAEGTAAIDPKSQAIASIRAMMAEHGISKEDLL
jgi:hypothetical protein